MAKILSLGKDLTLFVVFLTGPLPVSVYNAYLKCYLNLNHPFDPVQILVEMQKTGVGPDKVNVRSCSLVCSTEFKI